MTLEEIAKQYVWEKNLGNIGINTFLKESLFEPMYHIEIIAERYAKSQAQELIEQNAELVDLLKGIVKQIEKGEKIGGYNLLTTSSIEYEYAQKLLTKYQKP